VPSIMKKLLARPRVTDGAWGTQLQALGLGAGQPPEFWNAENPAAVEKVAAAYVQAGSEVILTNTFGANPFVLARSDAADRAVQLARRGAEISRSAAADAGVLVFGSIGPSGKIVMMGEVSRQELLEGFSQTAAALVAGGVDGIVLETFNELAEAEIALQAVKQAAEVPVVVCMTFASGPDKTATLMGEKPADLAALAQAGGADAVGANCGAGPDHYVKVARLLREATDLPIWIKPNAGLPRIDEHGRTVFPMGPEAFAAYVPQLLEAGVNFVGGCCGTTSEHVRAIRSAVDTHLG